MPSGDASSSGFSSQARLDELREALEAEQAGTAEKAEQVEQAEQAAATESDAAGAPGETAADPSDEAAARAYSARGYFARDASEAAPVLPPDAFLDAVRPSAAARQAEDEAAVAGISDAGVLDQRLQLLFLEPDDSDFYRYSGLFYIWFGEYIRIERAPDLERAVEEWNAGRYDVLIAEVVLPERPDPRQVIQDLLQQPGAADAPLAILSRADDPQLPLYAFREGASEFFRKTSEEKRLLEYRTRNLLQRVFRGKMLDEQVGDTIQRFHSAHGRSQEEIDDLNEVVRQMKRELEGEYENKIALEKEKNKMQQVFGMYVDPKIVEAVMNNELTVDQKGRVMDISVLFADIRGYTGLAERMQPQEVIAFLNTYFTAMTEVVMGYGGMVDKYIGDGIMCLFGAPVEETGHRDNALQAALEMQMVFDLWGPRWEEQFGIQPAMGIGVAAGQAVVGNVGSFQKISYTAVGDTVNVAARLESIAKGGEVIISRMFYEDLSEETRNKYRYESGEPVPIKGKQGTHKVYKVSYPA